MKNTRVNLLAAWLSVCWLILLFGQEAQAHNSYETHIVKHTETTQPHKDGFWARKTGWKSRWVKYWKAKTVYVPVWKKVWSPVVQNEWVPLPNAPIAGGGWSGSSAAGSTAVKEVHY